MQRCYPWSLCCGVCYYHSSRFVTRRNSNWSHSKTCPSCWSSNWALPSPLKLLAAELMFCAVGQSSPVRPSDLVNQLSSSSMLSAMKSECVWKVGGIVGRGEREKLGEFECETALFRMRRNWKRKGGRMGKGLGSRVGR